MAQPFSETMRDMQNIMDTLPSEQLLEIIKYANTAMDARAAQRRKELWGNVVAALQKYEREIDDISVDGDSILCLTSDYLSTPGELYTAN